MKIVSYYGGGAYFLTDKQFAAAVAEWNQGKSVFVESIQALLPPPKAPAGLPAEHQGLQIGFSWNQTTKLIPLLPGWVAIQKPVTVDGKEVKRGAVYWRAESNCEDGKTYYWKEINVRSPSILKVDEATTSEDVRAFIDAVGFKPVDEMLEDPEFRHAVPYTPLLPDYLNS